jgi:hypothetical protein
MIHIIGNTLIRLANHPNFEEMMENKFTRGMIVQGITIISVLSNEKDFTYYYT